MLHKQCERPHDRAQLRRASALLATIRHISRAQHLLINQSSARTKWRLQLRPLAHDRSDIKISPNMGLSPSPHQPVYRRSHPQNAQSGRPLGSARAYEVDRRELVQLAYGSAQLIQRLAESEHAEGEEARADDG